MPTGSLARRPARRRSRSRLGRSKRTTIAFSRLPIIRGLRESRIWSLQWLLSLGLTVAFSWMTYDFLRQPAFVVYQVGVWGNRGVTAEEVADAVSRLAGQNVFYVRPGQVQGWVQGLPGVTKAQVSLSLPNQVSIRVEDLAPEVVWQSGGTRYWVDQEGTVIRPEPRPADLLVVVDADGRQYRPWDRVDKKAILTVKVLANLLPTPPTAYEYSSAAGITVQSAEGWRACFGLGEDMAPRVALLQSILERYREKKEAFVYADLRSLERQFVVPAVRPTEVKKGDKR